VETGRMALVEGRPVAGRPVKELVLFRSPGLKKSREMSLAEVTFGDGRLGLIAE
jgi:hypothetical protein